MGRPRIHPRRYYRAIDSGYYVDQETGDELTYFNRVTILPNKDIETIPLSRQEKMAKKLVAWGIFEPLEDYSPEIERVSTEPTSIKHEK